MSEIDKLNDGTALSAVAVARAVENAKTIDAEPTEEQVKEYCRKRCLVIVNSELFNEMQARWSAKPVKHGHWEYIGGYGYQYHCSECIMCVERTSNYCPHCGAKMMEEVEA